MDFVKVEPYEIKALAELADEIWHEYWPCLLSEKQIDYMVRIFQSEDAIINQINNENYTYYFIIVKEQIAGYTGVSPKDGYLFLSKLYLKKEFRHLGFGKKAFEEIKQLGHKKIRLTVNKHNLSAYNAYLKYGFKVIDSVITDIGHEFVMDDYIMEYTNYPE